jgi:tRNA (cmo5U34)-methyltransferase
MSDKATEMFNQKTADAYDERFSKIGPIRDNLDFLIRLVLEDLPEDARILCVGVGTGIEIVKLANAYPQWRFTGVEPSAPMLEVCQGKLGKHDLMDRCELVHGYVSDLPPGGAFDAVLCLLVTQFVTDSAKRQEMFGDMAAQLKSGGYLINAEISDDMSSEHVAVEPPVAIERYLCNSGFSQPVEFFQSLLIHAWYARKS